LLQDRPLFFDPKREKRIVVFFLWEGGDRKPQLRFRLENQGIFYYELSRLKGRYSINGRHNESICLSRPGKHES